MSREISPYAIAREPYKSLFPHAPTHHMVPVGRDGAHREYNLFPWNEAAHMAWHQLFGLMTVREVWNLVGHIHAVLFSSTETKIVRMWCLSDFYHGKSSKRRDILTPQSVAMLRKNWVICFGDRTLQSAQNFLRYMMLFVALGRYAIQFPKPHEAHVVSWLLKEVESDSERVWAFLECFRALPSRTPLRSLRGRIHNIRKSIASVPIS